ncbi:hypothetical protein [Geomicrobium sp. JCM 19055]|uniref:hypothetical protein n=1 Tax=Geomicrobium sp. JCM 19055 TaxID=1460649 RepID=UPI00045ED21D|nr:hypothetical protein [Geomicrobium sp. JCM 19055]GAK00914.1 ribonucleotide reductase [Geomicrobium sp. JCM 19055]
MPQPHLPMRLQFFSEQPEGDTTATDNPSPEQKTESSEQKMIPKNRFDEVNTQMQEMKTQLAELQEEKRQAEEAKAEEVRRQKEEQGEYKDLLETAQTELQTYKSDFASKKERAEALEATINELVKTELTSIDEEMHELIPSNLSPEQKLEWINKAKAKGFFTSPSQEPRSVGSKKQQEDDTPPKKDPENMNPLQKNSSRNG